jgi:hypothetical protein
VTERQLRIASRAMAVVWVVIVVVIALQAAARENNNFLIFRTSWHNLAEGRDLYQLNPQHADYYKYSPTFALLFAPFAMLPLSAGLLLWTALNAGSLYWALGRIFLGEQLLAARAIVLIDAVGSMQNAQSNVLSAALIIFAFSELERRRELSGAIAVTLGTLVKLFPITAAAFAIFRPYRIPRFALWSVVCALVGIFAPLIVVSPSQLAELYRSWGALSKWDALTRGYSVMELLEMLFHADWPNAPIQLLGAAILVAPLRRYWMWGNERFRLLFLAHVLRDLQPQGGEPDVHHRDRGRRNLVPDRGAQRDQCGGVRDVPDRDQPLVERRDARGAAGGFLRALQDQGRPRPRRLGPDAGRALAGGEPPFLRRVRCSSTTAPLTIM